MSPGVYNHLLHKIHVVNFRVRLNYNTLQETGILNDNINYECLSHIYNDTIEERNMFLKDMNDSLKYMCKENKFIFYDLWEQLIDTDGVNIKWDLWNEHFIEYYQEVILYIKNY